MFLSSTIGREIKCRCSREIKVLSEEPFHIFLSEQNLENCFCHFVMKKPELDLVHMDFLPTPNPPYIFKGVVS